MTEKISTEFNFSYENHLVSQISLKNGLLVQVQVGSFSEKVVSTESGNVELFAALDITNQCVVAGKSDEIMALWSITSG